MNYLPAQSAAFELCQKTRVGPSTIQIEKPAAALERYRAYYSSSLAAAESVAANLTSLSSSIAVAQAAMVDIGWMSPAWKAAKERAQKSEREAQSVHTASTSGIIIPDYDGSRAAGRRAVDAEYVAAHAALAELEAAGKAAGEPILLMQQQLESAKATEAKHRADAARAATAIKVFDDLRAAVAAAEQKRLDDISRLLAQADKKAADDALRYEKICAIAAKLSVGHEVAASVLKYLQTRHYYKPPRCLVKAASEARQRLPALQAINRFATENGVRFQDAEEMLSS